MKRLKVFVEVRYYEIAVRPMRDGDVPTYYNGAGGLFDNHKNAFVSFVSAMRHIDRKRFDDSVVIHKSFENEFLDYIGRMDSEFLRWSDCGKWILR